MKKTALFLIAGAALAAGCASQKAVVKPEATPTPATNAADDAPSAHYVVRKGDSLWKIAASKDGLNDPFAWPLIFRANRDQIQDPDFIDVRQDLSIQKNYSKDDIADAVKKAEATAPYEPRKQPRKVLPIQY